MRFSLRQRSSTHLQELQARLKANGDPSNKFEPCYTTIDCGLIEGGTAHNIIPAECTIGWGLRSVPGDDTDAIVQEVFDFIEREVEPGLKAISPDAGVTHASATTCQPSGPMRLHPPRLCCGT